jgi:hypothetical protein
MSEQLAQDSAVSYAQFLRMALDALGVRALRLVALLLAFGLATFTIIQPSWPGAATSAVFTLLALLSTWRKGGAA